MLWLTRAPLDLKFSHRLEERVTKVTHRWIARTNNESTSSLRTLWSNQLRGAKINRVPWISRATRASSRLIRLWWDEDSRLSDRRVSWVIHIVPKPERKKVKIVRFAAKRKWWEKNSSQCRRCTMNTRLIRSFRRNLHSHRMGVSRRYPNLIVKRLKASNNPSKNGMAVTRTRK